MVVRDHSYITSALVGGRGVRKCQFLLILSTKNMLTQGGRGVQKSQKCDDVIYEWSLTHRFSVFIWISTTFFVCTQSGAHSIQLSLLHTLQEIRSRPVLWQPRVKSIQHLFLLTDFDIPLAFSGYNPVLHKNSLKEQ